MAQWANDFKLIMITIWLWKTSVKWFSIGWGSELVPYVFFWPGELHLELCWFLQGFHPCHFADCRGGAHRKRRCFVNTGPVICHLSFRLDFHDGSRCPIPVCCTPCVSLWTWCVHKLCLCKHRHILTTKLEKAINWLTVHTHVDWCRTGIAHRCTCTWLIACIFTCEWGLTPDPMSQVLEKNRHIKLELRHFYRDSCCVNLSSLLSIRSGNVLNRALMSHVEVFSEKTVRNESEVPSFFVNHFRKSYSLFHW